MSIAIVNTSAMSRCIRFARIGPAFVAIGVVRCRRISHLRYDRLFSVIFWSLAPSSPALLPRKAGGEGSHAEKLDATFHPKLYTT